ncbi:MAG: cytochrome c [Bacteroidetes bacterium]|nr:cytochrome c [Bacteroidota bacterium]
MKFKLTILAFASVFWWSFVAEERTLQDPLKESIVRGQSIYEDICMNCHMANGKGDGAIYPPLAQSDFLLKNRAASIRAVKYGISGKITVNGKDYYNYMADPGLSTQEVADVMNYILNTWGNKSEQIVTPEEVMLIVK